MKLIDPNFEIWHQEEGLEGIYKQIEKCGRICYASDPIEGKAKDFVDRMIKLNHGAVLEHGTVYLFIKMDKYGTIFDKYIGNKYSKTYIYDIIPNTEFAVYITTNLRVLIENDWLDDLRYLCEPTEYHEKRIAVKFTCDRIGSQSNVRHRPHSFGQESTRFCNFNKSKFDNQVKFSTPRLLNKQDILNSAHDFENMAKEFSYSSSTLSRDDWDALDTWVFASLVSEWAYFKLLDCGWKPEDARCKLSFDLSTEIVHTAFISDWRHFFALRSEGKTGKPHPDIKLLSDGVMNEFKQLNLI